jgi:hypothetical protein
MSLLTLLQSLQSPTSGISVVVNPYSFSNGFSNGFEQGLNYLSSTYNLNIALVSANATTAVNVSALPQNLSASYAIIPTSIIQGSGSTTSANVLSALYNISDPLIKAYVAIPSSVLSAIYNVLDPSITGDSNVSVTPLSGNYNINDATIVGKANVSATQLSANYSIQDALIRSGLTVSPASLSASYNLNQALVNFGTRIQANDLSYTYELKVPTIFNSFVVIPGILSASYDINGVNVRGNANVLSDVLSAAFVLNAPNILEGFGYNVSANSISATYNLENISITTNVKNLPNVLSATYNLEEQIVKGYANVSVDSVDANYNLLNPTLSITTTATGDTLNVTYTIEDPNIEVEVNYTFSADVISGAYNLNNPEVIIAIPEWFNCPQVPFNSYWRDDTECRDNERELYDTLITDTYNKFASVWVYYPTTYNITYDRVFKEDRNKFVVRAFSAMGFIEDIPPEHKTWQLEGIMGMDIVRAYFSIDHFTEASTFSGITSGIYETYQPTVGDICYLTPNNVFYEVINVKTTVEQFMNRSHNYELVLRVFRDNKMTVSADSPTLPFTDPIYTVCTSAQSATERFHDYLAINPEISVLVSAIEYVPKPGEKSSNAFGGW